MVRFFALLIALGAGLTFAADDQATADIAYLRLMGNYWQAWITDPQGARHKQLTFDPVDKARVSWSPDRKHLLCNSNDGTLTIVDPATSEVKPLILDALGVYDAQWSPDGAHITYSATTSLQADNAEIWVANIDGSEKRKITDHIAVALTPAWNPKAGSVLYSAGRPGHNQELWEVDPVSGHSAQLTVSKSSALDPSARADGAIAYSSDLLGNFNIWLLDASQKPSRLTESAVYDAQPSWSPDGKRIVFYRLDGKLRRLWVLDLESRKEYPITPADASSRYPAWIR